MACVEAALTSSEISTRSAASDVASSCESFNALAAGASDAGRASSCFFVLLRAFRRFFVLLRRFFVLLRRMRPGVRAFGELRVEEAEFDARASHRGKLVLHMVRLLHVTTRSGRRLGHRHKLCLAAALKDHGPLVGQWLVECDEAAAMLRVAKVTYLQRQKLAFVANEWHTAKRAERFQARARYYRVLALDAKRAGFSHSAVRQWLQLSKDAHAASALPSADYEAWSHYDRYLSVQALSGTLMMLSRDWRVERFVHL